MSTDDFISMLAQFRGISYEEAEKQVREDELVETVEAKVLGGDIPQPTFEPAGPAFESDPFIETVKKDQAESLKAVRESLTAFKAKPRLAGLVGDALIEATEEVMTHDLFFGPEEAEALGDEMASAFHEEMAKQSFARSLLPVQQVPDALMKAVSLGRGIPMAYLRGEIGKGSVIAENGVLLPCPRPTTPQEDYNQLISDTERKMTEPAQSLMQEALNAAAGIAKNTPTVPVRLFMSQEQWDSVVKDPKMTGLRPTQVIVDDPLKQALDEEEDNSMPVSLE